MTQTLPQGPETSEPFRTHHERRTAVVAFLIVVGFLAAIVLGCAFMPTIPLYHF
ncbi:hypothetical protein [Gluconacetobacter tumulisoli]|uniref:Uncharacterized protein n=1 Tax=Gluconacetobacter tumulisoli TaxID=1286189 RepID=A0A7W4KAJ1_9PROT|nr:hypothetical protein [Gluconacetobacter tumulisoli]MBB2203369.1 hypothetical protein [Gluconacetobacter tumulisoli]